MKKVVFLALLACGSMAAQANPLAPTKAMPDVAAASPFSFVLGVTQHHETYKEYDPSGGLIMKEAGNLVGVKAQLEHKLSSYSTAVYSAAYLTGSSDYTGSYIGDPYGSLTASGLSRNLIEVTSEYKLKPAAWNQFGLGIGAGYRRLTDNLQESGPGGYKRINELFYASVGIERDFKVNTWTITPMLKYKHLIRGKQTADLYGGIPMAQDKGKGSELSVKIAHTDDAGRGLLIEPFVRMWDIQESKPTHLIGPWYAVEPHNKTKEIGVNLSWRF